MFIGIYLGVSGERLQDHWSSVFFLIQFYVPFKIISAHMRRVKMGESLEKTPGTLASRTLLVPHVASAGLKPTPDTAVR